MNEYQKKDPQAQKEVMQNILSDVKKRGLEYVQNLNDEQLADELFGPTN